MGQTWRALLETVERPALKSLPTEPYGLGEWRIRRVGIDYQVKVQNHFYSVPHSYARAEVDARFTALTVEVFLRGERIVTHRRGSGDGDGKHTTLPDHTRPAIAAMPTGPSSASVARRTRSGR